MTPSERDHHYRIQSGHRAWTFTTRQVWPHIDRTGRGDRPGPDAERSG